jgi:hypothetical protein
MTSKDEATGADHPVPTPDTHDPIERLRAERDQARAARDEAMDNHLVCWGLLIDQQKRNLALRDELATRRPRTDWVLVLTVVAAAALTIVVLILGSL